MRFEEGDEVASVDNLELKMRVFTINKRVEDYFTGVIDGKGVREVKQRSRMEGISCHWWLGNDIQTHKFHTRELVPWEIAKQGLEACIEWQNKEAYLNTKN